jgi:hypothetical protein
MQRKENQCDMIERVELTHQIDTKKKGTKTNEGEQAKGVQHKRLKLQG